jgi:tetratricopeptide (TPR) repeat protein
MARGTQHLKKRAASAQPPKRTRADESAIRAQQRRERKAAEQGMFFPKLRTHAKWVFVLLALVFAGGFVLFGVGSGSSGLGDLLQGNSNGGVYLLAALGVLLLGSAAFVGFLITQPGSKSWKIIGAVVLAAGGIALVAAAATQARGSSISQLEKRVAKHPGDAQALLKLVNELRSDGRDEDAIDPLERYSRLRPKDATMLQVLAGLYLIRAQRIVGELNALDAELGGIQTSGFALPPNSFLVKEAQKDPWYRAQVSRLSQRRTTLLGELQAALSAREDAYRRAVDALPPSDTSLPGVVFAWAQAAEQAQDYKTALKAYQRYLELAPESSLAPDARKAIARIKKLLEPAKAGTAAG